MKYQVRVAILAEYDLRRLAQFLVSKSPSAADRAIKALRVAIESLADHPHRGRAGPQDDLKELIVPFDSGAYLMQYRIEAGQVLVVRLFHSRERR